jgi:glycosyltransferase involved in cell wall biosynthesis
VTGDVIVIQDADLEYHPEDYPTALRLIDNGWADAVYGSRFLGPHRVFLVLPLPGEPLSDIHCQCSYFRHFNRYGNRV